jgi:hypothetical protein
MLCLVIGAYCEGLGFVFRLVLRNNIHSNGVYIVMYLFVVLSVSPSVLPDLDSSSRGRLQPCAFLAGDYILLGRLVQHLDAPQYLKPLKPGVVSWTFIVSDST